MSGEEVLVPLAFFIFLGGVIIAHITARHKERMAMVEKGMSSEDIKALYVRQINRDPLSSLKWGILFVLGGLAVLLGVYLRDNYFANDGVIVGMVCLFVGIGLVTFYSIAAKKVSQ
ncbi:MAG: hypothetical protein HYR76_01555 [Ignavibacteria bacterium]|nr:hypothetical protein [Ignavibacteria bacterium]MBI3766714.1 hypothetical protein [Ignavibacteriales bacterium]